MRPPNAARPELVCIVCSGGDRDVNGAYTVCALCELDGTGAPQDLAA